MNVKEERDYWARDMFSREKFSPSQHVLPARSILRQINSREGSAK